MIGFMATTAFLSMWISNTASTAMMLPIANAVLKQLCETEANAEERSLGLRATMDGQDNQAFQMSDKENNGKDSQSDGRSITKGNSTYNCSFVPVCKDLNIAMSPTSSDSKEDSSDTKDAIDDTSSECWFMTSRWT